ncbi:MAG: penicillin-binding protein [bacterium]
MPIPKLKKRDARQYGRLTHSPGQRPTKPRDGAKKRSFFKPSKIIRLVAVFIVISFCCAVIGGTAAVAWVSKDLPSPDKLIDRNIQQSTKIYDRTGEHLLYEIFNNQKRTLVELDQISDFAKKATIAIEDKHFYEHKGIRIPSIIRAAFNNLIGRKAGSGGASTLTQQLIKNAVVGNEHSYFRKIREAIMAIRLERKYSKDEILKMYLNEIPYGSTNYGIEAASQSYFKKKSTDLTVAQAATLAAIPQAPSKYLNDSQTLLARRDLVIKMMYEQGYISESQKNEAQNSALDIEHSTTVLEAPHFVLHVKQMLADSFGEKTVDEGGLKVITTLDYDKQKIAEKAVTEIGQINSDKYKANNAALVAIDPKNGQILAMVGSRDFNDDEIDGKFNVAILGKRQPGSSFKPIIYTAAFAKGYTPDTVLYDVVTNFEKRKSIKGYTPHNYTNEEYGLITMRQALQGSLNIAAVKTLYLVGVENAMDFAAKMGYTTLTGDYGLSMVLGGGEVTLLEHTSAFATLANEGTRYNPVSILEVTDKDNNTLFKWKAKAGEEIVNKKIAATISNVLSDDQSRAYIFGLNSKLTLPGRPVCTKTGTTNDSKDAWTMGYTPSLAAGVWVGNTKPSIMDGGGSKLAAPIWNQFMREALASSSVENFPDPPLNEARNPVLRGSVGGITLKINKKTGRIANSTTPAEMIEEKKYVLPHTILHYIDKDDPNKEGVNSQNDPQYEVWEEALKEWIGKQHSLGNNISLQDPPTEYDDPQSLALIPDLKILFPTTSTPITDRNIEFSIEASAPRGVAEVNYYIDSMNIGSNRQHPFNISYYAKKLTKGKHTLKITAEDDQGNIAVVEFDFEMNAEFDPPSFEWFDQSPVELSFNDFPRSIMLEPFRWEDAEFLYIYLTSGSVEKLIYTFDKEDKLFAKRLMFTWNNYPGSGDYILRGLMIDGQGRTNTRNLDVVVK